ncbi:hypothetical protein A2U01_0003066 [Trifolium medium]|uniref:Uncharacterized protein n=1 Tax=Trifolium medium TaxID=97028 RepID=A0A392M4L4_9FABA|nr:hypothetical protein [Trifolium medium]
MKKSTLPCTNRLIDNANPITQTVVAGRKRLVAATTAHQRQKQNSFVVAVEIRKIVNNTYRLNKLESRQTRDECEE